MRHVALTILLTLPSLADDWGLRRSGHDPRIVAGMRAAAERTPEDDATFEDFAKLHAGEKALSALILGYQQRELSAGQRLLLLRLYWKAGRMDEARALVATIGPLQKRRRLLVARFQAAAGDVEAALRSYRACVEDGERETENICGREAIDLLIRSNPKEWVHLFEELHFPALGAKRSLELARKLSDVGLPGHAARVLDDALRSKYKPPLDLRAEMLRELATARDAVGEHDAAASALEQIVRILPGDHWLRREALERLVALFRKRDDLRSLRARLVDLFRRPGFAEHEALARLCDELGDTPAAAAAYRRALALRPHVLELRQRLIALLDRSGRDDEALAEQERLARIAPGEPRYAIDLAERLWRAGRTDEALARLARLGARLPREAAVHEALANLYARWGRDDLARRATEQAARLSPDDETSIVALGEQRFQDGRKRAAVDIWRRLLEVIPVRERAHVALAEVLAEHDLPEEAIEHYQKALRAAPEDAAIHRALALLLERLKRGEEAQAAWENVLRTARDPATQPWRREARTHLVHLWEKARTLHARRGELQRAFGAKPPDAEAGYLLAEARLRLRDLDGAARVFERLAELRPREPDPLLALEPIYRQLGDVDAAIGVLERLAALLPARARDFYLRASELAVGAYRDADALAYADKALAAPHGAAVADAATYAKLAEIHQRKGDVASAIDAWRKAITADPRMFDAHFALAQLHLRRREHADAARLYAEVLREASDDQMAARAGGLALDLAEYLGTLDELERALHPLASLHIARPIFRRLLVDLYARRAAGLARARPGETSEGDLARLGERAQKALLEALADEDDAARRRLALAALAEIPVPGAALPLLRLAERKPGRAADPAEVALAVTERVVALAALARVAAHVPADGVRHPPPRERLERLLADHEGAVREAAAFALATLADRASVPALARALSDAKPGVQAFACLGLGRAAAPGGVAAIGLALIDPRRGAHVRAACAIAAGWLGDGDAVPALLGLVDQGADLPARAAALALGHLRARDALRPLVTALVGGREPMRTAAAAALRDLVAPSGDGDGAPPSGGAGTTWDPVLPVEDGQVEWVGYLERIIAHDVERRRDDGDAATTRLALESPEAVAEGIVEALARPRDALLRALDAIGDEEAPLPLHGAIANHIEPTLHALVAHRDAEVRTRAIRVIGFLGGATSVDALAEAASARPTGRAGGDGEWRVRAAAAEALGRLAASAESSATAAGALARLLDDDDWRVRRAAAAALGASGATPAVATAPLTRALADPSAFVRETAARALGRLADPLARAALEEARHDGVPEVALAAEEALRALGSPR